MALVHIHPESSAQRREATAHRSESDPLWTAAFDSLGNAACKTDAPAIWREVIDGHLDAYQELKSPRQSYLLARKAPVHARPRRPLTSGEREVLRRVFGGDQQKAVAADLSIACSTASKWHTQALDKLRLGAGPVPLPLVVAAQSWTREALSPLPRGLEGAAFDHQGCVYFVLVVKRAAIPAGTNLTPAEQDVVRFLIDGNSRVEIAFCRSTSTQTVACQLRGVFSKLRATGRYALVRRAVELGWFE